MTTDQTSHWDETYRARDEDALTWFEETPTASLSLIKAYATPNDAILDVGGGASRLVDGALTAGFGAVTVLDLSSVALGISQARLGVRATRVDWQQGDITQWQPTRRYGVWHDRAVFHFLTDAQARAEYLRTMQAALLPGGTAIIASFALDGPETCSNLPVMRYSPDTLAAELERLAPGRFLLREGRQHMHVTPKGSRQSFQISVFRRAG